MQTIYLLSFRDKVIIFCILSNTLHTCIDPAELQLISDDYSFRLAYCTWILVHDAGDRRKTDKSRWYIWCSRCIHTRLVFPSIFKDAIYKNGILQHWKTNSPLHKHFELKNDWKFKYGTIAILCHSKIFNCAFFCEVTSLQSCNSHQIISVWRCGSI